MKGHTMEQCTLCPRRCRVNRSEKLGFCGMGVQPKLARAALHFWEEPCISGTRGSGAIFFSGCNLNCVYCQNYGISTLHQGKPVTVERLREIYEELGWRIPKSELRKLKVYGEPGRIAAFRYGTVWRMLSVVYGLELQ